MLLDKDIVYNILEYLSNDILVKRHIHLYRNLLFSNKVISAICRRLYRDRLCLVWASHCHYDVENHFQEYKSIFSNPYFPLTVDYLWPCVEYSEMDEESFDVLKQATTSGLISWKNEPLFWTDGTNSIYAKNYISRNDVAYLKDFKYFEGVGFLGSEEFPFGRMLRSSLSIFCEDEVFNIDIDEVNCKVPEM